MEGTTDGPWNLQLEVIDVLGEPGCGWNYAPGFTTLWDGRHFPDGMCPFAWNAFAPIIWAQRYAVSNRSLGKELGDELLLVCPDSRHQILWKLSREGAGSTAGDSAESPVLKLGIDVDDLPRGPGCDRGYAVGQHWDYDGAVPHDFCPLAWQTLSLWVWPLRYGASPRPMEWEGDSVKYNCPNADSPVVFHVYRVEESEAARGGA